MSVLFCGAGVVPDLGRLLYGRRLVFLHPLKYRMIRTATFWPILMRVIWKNKDKKIKSNKNNVLINLYEIFLINFYFTKIINLIYSLLFILIHFTHQNHIIPKCENTESVETRYLPWGKWTHNTPKEELRIQPTHCCFYNGNSTVILKFDASAFFVAAEHKIYYTA